MKYYLNIEEEKNIIIRMTIIFIIGGILGNYVFDELFSSNSISNFIYMGYFLTGIYIFIRLMGKTGWYILELPTLDFVLIYVFAPFILSFFVVWYLIKLVFILWLSFLGVVPIYLWNIKKIIFN